MATPLHTNYQIRWKNYRRFADTGWVTLKPLTILLGANNGGKSSILSPLLLLAQTLASSDREVPLLPFGPLIDLGSYKDFVHLHETSREVFLGVRFHTHAEKPKLKAVGHYPPGGIELTLAAGQKPEQIRLKCVEVTDIYNRQYFSRSATPEGYSLDGAISFNEMKDNERKALQSAEPMNFLFSPNDVFYELDGQSVTDKESKPTPFSKSFSNYLRAVGFTYSSVRALFDQLSYVGPLRAKLQRFYRVSPELPDTVGAQGEHAANLFRRSAGKLKPGVDAWVKKFEFGEELRYNELTADLFELVFKSGKEVTNVADAGFGASQVLPLIIQAVAAPHNSLTIAEQPEIHLNPRLQCVLADLFVQMATSGHRVIVETHSDHLIVSLRRLIAEGKISTDQVNLMFVEKTSGESTIKEIPIQPNGNIERQAWPTGFFEEGLREALALAAAQSTPKRQRAKRERSNAAT
jgi:predicted ATPase